MAIIALCFTPKALQAQALSTVKAYPDNVFVEPTSGGVFWDVLRNDDPGVCLPYTDLKVSIFAPPTRAMYCDVLSNYIYYIPDGTGFSGRDSLIYEIECEGVLSRAKVYININNTPNNVYTDICHVPIPAIDWKIKKAAMSTELVSIANVPLTGDLDGDGNIEIVVMNPNASGPGAGVSSASTELLIFGFDAALTNPLYVKYRITIPLIHTAGNTYVIANVDGNKYASVFLTTNNTASSGTDARQLIKYSFNGTGWSESWRRNYSTLDDWSGCTPIVADFTGTGSVQVAVYDKIFNAQDGTLLVDGNFLGKSGYNFGRLPHNGGSGDAPGRPRYASWTSADIDNDGKLEIIAGNCVYKVNINDPNSFNVNNTYTLFQTAPGAGDGAVAVADMDGDGFLDVVMTWRIIPTITPNDGRMTIYDPRNGTLMSSVVSGIPVHFVGGQGCGPSSAFIGDITGDGKPNIVFTGNSLMDAYSYDHSLPVANRLKQIWRVSTSDGSASTVMSLFDFNQDGIAELVYRDETHLRIINGSMRSHKTGKDTIVYNLASFENVKSTTIAEYPIVADVNGDGAAEIITTGHTSAHGWTGFLWVFDSGAEPWAPARSVWDRYHYNPVYVNDDLTIPQYPLNPATPFINSDTILRPFNNYLQQATALNDKGLMLYLGPDLQFDPYKRPTLVLDDSDNMHVNIRIGNIGDADLIPPLHISTYVYDTPSDTYTLMYSLVTNDTVKVGKNKDITFVIPGYSSLPFPASYDRWYIFLNSEDDSPGTPSFPYITDPIKNSGINECAYWNNRSANISFTYGERVICKDKTEPVTLSPSGVYDYKWFDAAAGGVQVASGDTYNVLKDGNLVQRYYIDTYSKSTGAKLNAVRDTVNIYLAPDTLIWTGSIDADWHNFSNWKYIPSSDSPNRIADSLFYNVKYPQAKIPRKCTNVLIPDGIVTYSDLRNIPGTATSYEEYVFAECANITFEHGGEVRRTDSLDYDAGYVRLKLNANRWYMLSAPLRSMFTGDYYEIDANPLKDNVEVYTRLYRSANPETGESDTDAWGWTGVFHNPYIEMTAGTGISFWPDNRLDIHTITGHQFFFPKKDVFYNVYARSGQVLYTVDIERNGLENRFVYEDDGMLPPSNGKVMLAAAANNSNEQLIVGNPFMSHLDFNQFYTANSTYIKNYYQVLDKNDGVFVTYTATGANTGTGTGTPALTRYIPPMQSVLVESVSSFPVQTLFAGVDMVSNVAGAKLRSGMPEEPEAQSLIIEVSRADQKNRSLLMYSPEYEETNESINKTFLKQFTEAITVYTCDPKNGKYTDILKISDLEGVEIPLGIRTSVKGKFRLNFGGLSSFAPDYDIYLNDSETGISRNLREGSVHLFEKTKDDLFDNRFTLSFFKSGTGIARPRIQGSIDVYVRNDMLRIATADDDRLQSVEICDIRGNLISTDKNIRSNTYEKQLPKNIFYIIRVRSDRQVLGVKIIN